MKSLLASFSLFALALTLVVSGAAMAAGAESWSFKTGAEVFSVPATDATNAYFGSYDGNVYCLDKATGKERWRRGGLRGVSGTPVIYASSIVFCAYDDRVCALGRETGAKLWEVPLEGWGRGLGQPKLAGDRLLIPTRNQIAVLDPTNGQQVGSYELAGDYARVCWNSNLVCAVASDNLGANDEAGVGQVAAFRHGTKRALWTTPIGGACWGEIACDETRCYVGARDGYFYAVNLATGKTAWRIDCRGILASTNELAPLGEAFSPFKRRVWADGHVTLAGNRVLFSVGHQAIEQGAAIVAADKESGNVLWIASHPSSICGRFAVTEHWVFAATQDRELLAISFADGKRGSATRMPKGDRGEFAGVAVDKEALLVAGADGTVSRIPLRSLLQPALGATPPVPDERDRQVLETLLLHLLSDAKFDMTRVAPTGATIILHPRTPEKTGFLLSRQIRSDLGSRTLPSDAENDLRRRNTPPDAAPDIYSSAPAFYTNLTFAAGIVVTNSAEAWDQGRKHRSFQEAHPRARGWLMAFLPGFSSDGTRAVVRAAVGPWAHAAMLTAVLEKSGDKWVVKWYHISRYA